MAEVKPEQLMTNLIKGTELNEGEVEITSEREELFDLYNSAVDMVDYGTTDYMKYEKIMRIVQQAFGYMVINNLRYGMITSYVRTWFLKRDQDNANIIYISPMVPINQQHTKNQASFLECIRYFEDISSIETNAYSLPSEPYYKNYQEDLDSLNSNQSDHDSGDDYKPKSKRKKVNNSEVNTRITRSKSAQTSKRNKMNNSEVNPRITRSKSQSKSAQTTSKRNKVNNLETNTRITRNKSQSKSAQITNTTTRSARHVR